jgi:hypothetical protein
MFILSMGCNTSKSNLKNTIISKEGNIYKAYTYVNRRYRLLCESSDISHIDTIIEKYHKNSRSFHI